MSKQIITLFDNQAQAGQAIQALSASSTNFDDYRVIEESDQSQAKGQTMPAMNPGNSMGAGGITAPAPNIGDAVMALDLPDDAARFYQQGLDNGGVVLVVKAADDISSEIRDIFDNFGGKVAQA